MPSMSLLWPLPVELSQGLLSWQDGLRLTLVLRTRTCAQAGLCTMQCRQSIQ